MSTNITTDQTFLSQALTTDFDYVSNYTTDADSNQSNYTDTGWLDICVVGSTKGYIAPIGGDVERLWNPYLLATLYIVGLVWCFIGVSIIADIFMLAIEKITSVDRIITREDGTKVRVRTWNDTVANLTLMAMGSSAPEILLNVIEICGGGFYSGDLGPSTVVGSAAFNLLVINAFCTFAIAKGEIRRVKEAGVYAMTSTCSIFAYVWMVLMLVSISPDIVETWEAIVTFLGFPLLVIGAYLIDTKRCECRTKKKKKSHVEHGVIRAVASMDNLHHDSATDEKKQQIAQILREVRQQNQNVPKKVVMQLVINTMIDKNRTKRSHAFYRVSTSRKLHGLEDLPPKIDKKQTIADATSLLSQLQATGALDEDPELGKHSVVSDQNLLVVRRMHFSSREYAVVESSGQVQMAVRRPVTGPQHVRVVSRDGTAKVKDDYKHIDIILDFGGSNEVIFSVDIVSDNTYEETEHFFVDLYPVDAEDLARAQESSSSKVEMITNDDSTNDGMVTGSTKVTLTLDTKGPAQKNTNMRSSKVSPMGVTEPKRRSSSFDNIKTKVKPLDTYVLIE